MFEIIGSFVIGVIVGVVGLIVVACTVNNKFDDYDDYNP